MEVVGELYVVGVCVVGVSRFLGFVEGVVFDVLIEVMLRSLLWERVCKWLMF